MKNDKVVLDIVDNGANGSGVAKKDGLVCFVPYSIAGEKVEASVKTFHKNFCECSLQNILSSSSGRVEHKCPYFGKCGGCQLQHMSQEFQLAFKTKQVKSMLERTLKQNIEVLPCIAKNEYSYRNKVNFQIVDNALCFSDNNQQFFHVLCCPLFEKNLRDLILTTNDYLQKYKPNFRALHVRVLHDIFQLTFVSNSFAFPHFEDLISNFLQKNINFSLNICKNSNISSSNLTDDIVCVYGDKEQYYGVFGLETKVSPASFLQVNREVQNAIYEDITSQISDNSEVINAYGGTGILSAFLSKKARRVHSIEQSISASKNCEDMILRNKLKNVVAICGDCKNEIPKVLANNKISHIVFDPPRNGVNKSILETLKTLDIPNIIYLSCNPSTLARDLKILSTHYEIARVQPFDMFPQTQHIETLVTLKRRKI